MRLAWIAAVILAFPALAGSYGASEPVPLDKFGLWSTYGIRPTELTVLRDGFGNWSTNLDWNLVLLPETGRWRVTYLSPTGSDANLGDSPTRPRRSLSKMLRAVSNDVIVLQSGAEWTGVDGWNGTDLGGHKVVVSSDPNGRPAILSTAIPRIAWNKDTGTTWFADLKAPVGCVIDESIINEHGSGRRLIRAASLDECRGTAGTYFVQNFRIYTNVGSSAASPSKVQVFADASNGVHRNARTGLWVRNVEFRGGKFAFHSVSVGGWQREVFWNCTFRYANDNTDIAHFEGPGRTILVGSNAFDSNGDGFDYRMGRQGIEDRCVAAGNGALPSSPSYRHNNGSTAHGATVIRIGGSYSGSGGPNVHEAELNGNPGASLNLGIHTFDSAGPSWYGADLGIGVNAASPTRMWIVDHRWSRPDGTPSRSPHLATGTGGTIYKGTIRNGAFDGTEWDRKSP